MGNDLSLSTRRDVLVSAMRELHGVSAEARLDALRLIEYALGITPAQLIASDDAIVAPEDRRRLQGLLERRRAGEPVAYICGEAWFFGRRFAVDARVLVPRPETELLVELALAHLRERAASPGPFMRIADIGTGSGAIAITLAAELPQAQVVAVDRSSDALVVAENNARTSGLAQRITFLESDLLSNLDPDAPFDCLAANLPYLRSDEMPAHPDPVAFEPRMALDGGPDGIAYYRRMFERLPTFVRPGGIILLEAAPPTMPALEAAARTSFAHARVAVVADYAGSARVLRIVVS